MMLTSINGDVMPENFTYKLYCCIGCTIQIFFRVGEALYILQKKYSIYVHFAVMLRILNWFMQLSLSNNVRHGVRRCH